MEHIDCDPNGKQELSRWIAFQAEGIACEKEEQG